LISDKLKSELDIIPCKISEYDKLKQYVYVNRPVPPPIAVYKVAQLKKFRTRYPDPIAVIVYSMPLSCIAARNVATNNFFIENRTRSEQLKLINERIVYISRLVVTPHFWKLGIGSWLQEETVKMQTKPIIEVLTQYDFTADTLKKIGFKLYLNRAPEKYHKILDAFAKYGITGDMLNHPGIVWQRIQKLRVIQQGLLFQKIKCFLHGFNHIEKHIREPKAIEFLLDQLKYPHAYLIKESEEHKISRRHPQ